jgi:hypothetical protein
MFMRDHLETGASFNKSEGAGSSIYKKKCRGQATQYQRETAMKYQVTYRLMQPQTLPAIASTVVDAYNHRELDARLARIKTKWQAQGYTIQILRVIAGHQHQRHSIHASKS